MTLKWRWVVLVASTAFAVTLGVVVGQRLSTETMAVLLGVLAGALASIPTSLLVMWVAARRWLRPPPTPPAPAAEPRIVVVPNFQPPPTPAPSTYREPPREPSATPAPETSGRRFTIIGGEDDEGTTG